MVSAVLSPPGNPTPNWVHPTPKGSGYQIAQALLDVHFAFSIPGTFLFTLFTCHDVVPLPLCRATREGSKGVDIPLPLTAYREPQEGVGFPGGSRVAELYLHPLDATKSEQSSDKR